MLKVKHSRVHGFILLSILAIVMVTSCAALNKSYHHYIMKGSIIDKSDSEVYLCIGSADGATVGQELNVYKIIKVSHGNAIYRRELTGKVKITQIIDEHFAKAEIISGTAEKNDVVELKSK